MLIVADGEDIRDLVPDDNRIRLIHLEGDPLLIGEKRNFGCERALGEIIFHFDDDDFSAPGRMADQLQRLHESGKSVTGYHSMRFSDGTADWMYEGVRNYAIGTSLCYRREWWESHRFPAIQIEEDSQFGAVAWAHGQLSTEHARDLMWASNHTGNTSPRTLGANWRKL